MQNFLRPQELTLMMRDFSELMDSSEVTLVDIHYSLPVSGVYFQAYDETVAASWQDVLITGVPALYQIVNIRSYGILRWGILAAGDAIFYFKTDVAFSGIDYNSAYIRGLNTDWFPVPPANTPAWDSLMQVIGGQQFAQVIPCRLKR